MSIDDLLNEFLEIQDALQMTVFGLSLCQHTQLSPDQAVDRIVHRYPIERAEGGFFDPCPELNWKRYSAAKTYQIARDESMDAALLWKLANG